VIAIVAVKTVEPLVLYPGGESVQFVPIYSVTHDRPIVVAGNPPVVMVSVEVPEPPGAEMFIGFGLTDKPKSALLTTATAEVEPE
jgi:hypothetical protein